MSQSKPDFRAAVVQTLAALDDLDTNIGLVRDHVQEAVRQGADLVVLPECMNSGYLFDSYEHARRVAEPVTGRYVSALAELCRAHGIYIASGFTEWDPDREKIFNTALLLNPAGDLILHYHKQFLATHDQNWFSFGERGCPVVDTPIGRIGLLICFDGRIPEIARSLALQGAEVVLDMANFFAMDQADQWVPARAYENGYWIVAATKAGVERSIYYPGGSMIVDPDGATHAYIPYDTHGVTTATVEPGRARDKRWHYRGDRFADRRPEAYETLAVPFDRTPLAGQLSQNLIPEQATTKVAAIQAHASDRAGGGIDDTLALLEHTALLGAKVLALPLNAAGGTWAPTLEQARGSLADGERLLEGAATICARHACLAVIPLFESHGAGLLSNAVLIGPGGNILGRQPQVHVEPEQRAWVDAGTGFNVFETPFGRLGVLLGYDGQFPESARVLALQGADIIVWAAAWRHGNDRRLLTVPKAEDNRCYLVAVNRSDAPIPGGSLIVPPTGFPQWDLEIAAPRQTRHGAVMPAFVNLALARQKSMIPGVDMIRNRLVDSYSALVATAPREEAASA